VACGRRIDNREKEGGIELIKKPRIGWISAPLTAATGYGKVTKETCFRLADMGYEVINIGGRGGAIVWGEKFDAQTPKGNLVPVLPAWGHIGNPENIAYYISRYKIDVLITLCDAFAFNIGRPRTPWIAHFPIDAPLTRKWLTYLTQPDVLCAMSQYGQNQLSKYYPQEMIDYIPHGVDTFMFHPASPEEKTKLRDKWGIPQDAFLFIDLAANWGERKNLPQTMITFKRFLERHPDSNAYLYLFTLLRGDFPKGYDLLTFSEELGLEERIMAPVFNPELDSVDEPELAELYRISDVLLNPSLGEGFGLSLIEAMASGVPCIATNCSSMTELVGGHGWLVDTIPAEQFEFIPVWVPMLARYPIPDCNSLLECMSEAYTNPELRLKYGKESRKFALQYDWNRIMPLWDSLIMQVWEEHQKGVEKKEEVKE